MALKDYLALFGQLDPAYAALLGGGLGALCGSYLATLLVRWPAGMSASSGRSCCDHCGRTLRPIELIPLVSFIAVAGRCRTCLGPIDRRLPLMEAICAATGAILFALEAPLLAPFVWVLLTLAAFDLAHLWLPDRLVAAAALLALIAPPLDDGLPFQFRLLGGAAGFAVLAITGFAFKRITGRTGLGGGDPKLFGAIGLWAGIFALPLILICACAIGLANFAALHLLRGGAMAVKLPFGTYLGLATIVVAVAKPILAGSV